MKHLIGQIDDINQLKDSDFSRLYSKNLVLTKKQIKESVSKGLLIIQAVNTMEDLEKIINQVAKRLREWYALYFPELENVVSSNERFAELSLLSNILMRASPCRSNVRGSSDILTFWPFSM